MSRYYSEWYENFIETIDELGNDELFSAYRSMLSSSSNTFALNRKVMEKAVDVSWVEAIEKGLQYVDNVMRNPRKTIENVEEVVPIALSKKITVDSIKHLAQHTDLIQSIDPETGKITPSKILNVHKEESLMTYENKFVNTLIDRLYIFVNRRYEKLKAVTHDEEVYTMEYVSQVETDSGQKLNMTLKIETVDSLETVGASGSTMWERVEKIKKIIESYKASPFCQEMGQAYIRPPVMRTNAIMKNVDLKGCLTLWQFIEGYDKVGFEINISDSAQKPNDSYIQDLYSLTALNYLLFRSFTSESNEELTELKTAKSKTVAPKILRRFDKNNPDAYDMAVDGGGNVSTKGDYTFARKLPKDTSEIITEINKIIKIETEYLAEEERAEEEARRIEEEKERKRFEEEQRRLEQERLAQAQREEEERLEQQRLEQQRIAEEKARQAELERQEQERLEAERAEQERIDAETAALIEEERKRLSQEELERKAKLDEERKAREEREQARADKLKAMRTEIEKREFSEIYPEYSKNPVHVAKRTAKRVISLIRKDGRVLWEGDTTEPVLAERIALEAKQRREAEREKAQQEEMERLYEKYIPNRSQRRKQKAEARKRKKNRVYRMPSQPPIVRTPEEQKAIDREMHELFRKYHVGIFEKIKREFEEFKRKVKRN